ncbi:MAG: hypothetical protein ACKVOW_14000 [Chitinophagaceae bacterium]
MQRSLYNDDFDFEQLIKQKSDQYKIYPSSKVWRGIHNSLHSSRRWYLLSFVLFMAGISYYSIDQLSAPPRKNNSSLKNSSSAIDDKSLSERQSIILPFTSKRSNTVISGSSNNYDKRGPAIEMNELSISQSNSEKLLYAGEGINDNGIGQDVFFTPVKNDDSYQEEKSVVPVPIAASSFYKYISPSIAESGAIVKGIEETKLSGSSTKNAIALNNEELNDHKKINWLQENALYEFSKPKSKRISYLFTLSPTMNYRKLTGGKNGSITNDAKNIPISFNIEGDVDRLVNHKPALGFELGSMVLYAVNKNLTFKAGLQFNYSRYNIQAYSSYSTDRATIALNNFYGTNPDSITTYTRLRNFGGNSVKDLKNEYFQLSAPIGIELLVLGRGKLQFSVAGTIQPTYLINRDNYLITTDYKNYTREPSLVRRWNVNTGAEAFVSYKTGGFKFQLGPQLRYQLLSSYDDKYPVKEFLTEYGIKFGISKAIR